MKRLGFYDAERIFSEVRVVNGTVTQIGGTPGGPRGSHNIDIMVARPGQSINVGQSVSGGVAEAIGDLKYGGGVINPKYGVHGSPLITITGRTTPGPAPVVPEPIVPPPSPAPRSGGGVGAGGAITGALWAIDIIFAVKSYWEGSVPNTPAPVGNGMIGGSRGEAILNAAGTLAGGLPAGTMLRQAAEFGSTGSDPRKVWNAITSGTASPTSIGMGIYFGAFR